MKRKKPCCLYPKNLVFNRKGKHLEMVCLECGKKYGPLKDNPYSKSAAYIHKRLAAPSRFAPGSFRTVPVGAQGRMIVVACPRGGFVGGKCVRGMKAQGVLIPKMKKNPLTWDENRKLERIRLSYVQQAGKYLRRGKRKVAAYKLGASEGVGAAIHETGYYYPKSSGHGIGYPPYSPARTVRRLKLVQKIGKKLSNPTKWTIYDAFPTKQGAQKAAVDFIKGGLGNATVRKLFPAQDSGRLKWGVFVIENY